MQKNQQTSDTQRPPPPQQQSPASNAALPIAQHQPVSSASVQKPQLGMHAYT